MISLDDYEAIAALLRASPHPISEAEAEEMLYALNNADVVLCWGGTP